VREDASLKIRLGPLGALCLLFSLVAGGFNEAHAAGEKAGETARSPREPVILMLIKKLGAPDWEAREAARRRLLAIGDEVLPYLEKYFKDEDRERAWRARELHKAILWKVPKILLEKVGPLIEDYTTLTKKEKMSLLITFSSMPPQDLRQGASFLAKMIRFDPDLEIKKKSCELYIKVSAPGLPEWDGTVLETLKSFAKPAFWVLFAKAQLHQRFGQRKEALQAARDAYSLNAKDLALMDLLVRLLIENKNYKEALPFVESMTKLEPNNHTYMIRLGECLVALGEREKGLKVLNQIFKFPGAGQKSSTYVELSQVFLRLGFGKEALKTCEEGLKKFPYDRGLNVALAESEWKLGRKRQAFRRFLSEMRYTVPNTGPSKRIRKGLEAILNEAGCKEFSGREEFWSDLERGRPVAKAHDRLARWLEDRGLDPVVVPELKLVSLMWWDDLSIRMRLGQALERMGQSAHAKSVYQAALKLDPKSEEFGAALTRLKASGPKKGTVKTFSGLSFWERSFERGKSPVKMPPRIEGPFNPSPLVTPLTLVVARPDVALLTAYARKDGNILWNVALPAPGVGQLVAGEVGVEALGLIEVPAGVAMRFQAKRAFENKPLIAVTLAAWERSQESKKAKRWNGAFFRGLWVALLEPKNGARVALYEIPDAKAPQSRLHFFNSTAVYRSKRGESRHKLNLIDLAAGKVTKFWQLRGRRFTQLTTVQSSILVSYSKGQFVYGRRLKDKGQRLTVPGGVSSIVEGSPLHLLARDGKLYRQGKAGKPDLVLEKVLGSASAGLAVNGSLLLTASRDGQIQAFDLKNKGALLWRLKLDQGAERHFHFSGPVIFLTNGLGDVFPGEVPYVVGLDRKTGTLVWKRPFEPPATFAFKNELAVLISGGQQGVAHGKVMTVKIGENNAKNRGQNLVIELRSAAFDAFQGGEYEVSNLLFRLYRSQRPKNAGKMSLADQIWYARILARSNRPLIAENVLATAEDDLQVPDPKRFHKLRQEMGLEAEDWPDEEKDKKVEDKPRDKAGKKGDEPKKEIEKEAGKAKEAPKEAPKDGDGQ
jgi:tetratricopeptide (TPR) repeat protein